MKFKLEIELGNDEMRTKLHVARALSHLAKLYRNQHELQPGEKRLIFDRNGNSVGFYGQTKR